MNAGKHTRADRPDARYTARNRTVEIAVSRLGFTVGGEASLSRSFPVEAPVAVEVCGIGYAVMMATPTDLEDFATGFALSEGLVGHADEIESITPSPVEGGWILRIELAGERRAAILERARTRVSESSCGLCGMENIEQVLRPLPALTGRIDTTGEAIARAVGSFTDFQPLNYVTGAVHGAAFCSPDGAILAAREDVGRHNALDKLVGALVTQGIDPATGFMLLSARCSFELVEKTVRAGCPMLVTISAPTSLAVERAQSAGLTLVTLARADSALVVCDAKGMIA